MTTTLEPNQFPVAIAAFEGWNDAGDAASDALLYLRDEWQATKIATISAEDYVDYSMTRPTVHRSGSSSWLMWPDTTIWRATLPTTGMQVLLVHGVEPALRWRQYADELVALLEDHGVNTLIGIGALLADVPHTRPLPVYLASDDEQLQSSIGLSPSEYQGPTGILGVLGHEAQSRGVASISAWVGVPHYVSASPSPSATLQLVNKVGELVGDSPYVQELYEDSQAWQRGVEELAESDPEIEAYVRALEDARDTAELPEASGEAIAAEFERYLRRRRRPPEDRPGAPGTNPLG